MNRNIHLRGGFAAALVLLSLGCRSAPQTGVAGSTRVLNKSAFGKLVDSLVDQSAFRGMQWGVLVVDPQTGDTLYSRNAGKVFVPASNQKLLTGAVALEALGPDFRFTTQFSTNGTFDSVLTGDLLVRGFGDPSLSDHMAGSALLPFNAIADSLTARGIRRIAGNLRPHGDAFPGDTLGFGWAWDDMEFPYSAGVDELYVNDGFMNVSVRGTRVGERPVVSLAPASQWPTVRNEAITMANDSATGPAAGRIRVSHVAGNANVVVVSGTIAPGDSVTRQLTYLDHRLAYLQTLREALQRGRIPVGGGISLHSEQIRRPIGGGGAFEPAGLPLFSTVSPPLSEILKAFEKPSQNQIGEILLRTLGRTRAGVGRPDSGARVVRDQLIAWGAPPDGFRVRDGSGLSRHNVVSPEVLIKVLAAMHKHTHFRVFRDALPVAGVDGTLRNRMRGTAAERKVHAKTGTLDMVRSLSGYVTTADGHTLLFSMLANHWLTPVREIERVQDTILIELASSSLSR